MDVSGKGFHYGQKIKHVRLKIRECVLQERRNKTTEEVFVGSSLWGLFGGIDRFSNLA